MIEPKKYGALALTTEDALWVRCNGPEEDWAWTEVDWADHLPVPWYVIEGEVVKVVFEGMDS